MKKDLSKLYEHLNGEERFKMVLAALARDDETDALQLKSTCPRKTYSMSEAAYIRRLETSHLLALSFALDWLLEEWPLSEAEQAIRIFTRISKIMVISYTQGANMGWKEAGREDPPPFSIGSGIINQNDGLKEGSLDAIPVKIPEQLQVVLDMLKQDLKTTLQAFETFCSEIGVPVDHLLAWFPPAVDWINARRESLADTEPNEELLKKHLNVYRKIWSEQARD